MNLEQLQYLIEIANTGSISAAAERLHISQPSISQSILNLEKELQIKIFNRTRTGTIPTKAGMMIIEKAKEALQILEQIESISQIQSSMLSGSFSLGVIPSIGNSLLPMTLSIYKEKFPGIQIEVIEGGTNRVMENVLSGKVDIGLIAYRKPYHLDKKLTFIPLLYGKVLACVGRTSKLAKRSHISFQEIVKYPIVTFNHEYNMKNLIVSKLKKYGKPNLMFTAGNSETAKKIISQGIVIGFYAELSLKTDPYVLSGEIIPLHISDFSEPAKYGIIHKKEAYLSVQSREFINELKIQVRKFTNLYNLQPLI